MQETAKDEPRRYGEWAGNEAGVPEKPDHCIIKVWPPHTWISRQCMRPRGFGPEGLHCKQHAKILFGDNA